RLEVHRIGVAVAGFGPGFVHEVGESAGYKHHDAHHEDPHQQLYLHFRLAHTKKDKGDQSHAGHAIGLESVGAGADRVAHVVTGAIGNHARVASIVLFDLEYDLHEIGADVGNLGKDTAGDA